jgi:hypothetical protein
MRRSITNPRIVLGYLAFVVLIWSIFSAYLERPRIIAEFGGLADTVSIRQDRLSVDVRSSQFRDRLEKRLGSASFMDPLLAENSRMSRLFLPGIPTVTRIDPVFDLAATSATGQPGTKAAPARPSTASTDSVAKTVTPGLQGDRIVFWTRKSGKSDLFVTFLYLRSYRVSEPSNKWIAWFQRWLPGMPNAERLKEIAAEAEAANQTAKDAIKAQIEAAAEQAASGH